ncbi:hypothetical protein ACHAWT_009697 [Skeletonema menzelii]
MTTQNDAVAKPGPEPTLISRRQVDALYEVLSAVTSALNQLNIPYIVTGGSLLGAVRQHSILFCDDDIDLAILEEHNYERAKSHLQSILGNNYKYSVRPWEGGDKVRLKRCSNVFLDIFCIRRYSNFEDLNKVIGVKKNGESQSDDYVDGIMKTICKSLHSQGEIESSQSETNHQELPCPIWHFNTRKAIELWPKETYRDCELYPLTKNLEMGPVLNISGPHTPVRLLKRAFGEDCFDVYYQSMSHGDSKSVVVERETSEEKKDENNNNTQYPPHISVGGQWTQSTKTPLSEEHYIPMQSKSRAKRRFTTHCKKSLFEYLDHQTHEENISLTVAGVLPRPRKTIYLDGVMDLFHIGHLKSIEQCAALGDRVIIGITGDQDAMGYKRRPIINEADRTAIVQSLKMVDHVVCPCPLLVTTEFMQKWDIDLVVHGFADKNDRDKQIDQFFKVCVEEGKFQEINYYSKMSTTDIISRIKSDEQYTNELSSNGVINPKWFGAALAAATSFSSTIPFDPFPIQLRNAIEPHIQKARDKQGAALNAARAATTGQIYDEVLSEFMNEYAQEGSFTFDTNKMKLRESFLESCGLGLDFDLQRLHQTTHNKDEMLFHLASNRLHFQEEYDNFARTVCIPYLASLPTLSGKGTTPEDFYYQSFPCIRIVKPGEFSIGPHGDASYGHHPCSINFYIPLTKIEGSASLFLESRPGSEDWHPIVGEYSLVKVFAGAVCKHFTPENWGDFTRVSLDFRIIPGHMFHSLKCGGCHTGGVKDVYRQKEGYYTRCYSSNLDKSTWERDGPLQEPDARYGFPWTKVNQNKK